MAPTRIRTFLRRTHTFPHLDEPSHMYQHHNPQSFGNVHQHQPQPQSMYSYSSSHPFQFTHQVSPQYTTVPESTYFMYPHHSLQQFQSSQHGTPYHNTAAANTNSMYTNDHSVKQFQFSQYGTPYRNKLVSSTNPMYSRNDSHQFQSSQYETPGTFSPHAAMRKNTPPQSCFTIRILTPIMPVKTSSPVSPSSEVLPSTTSSTPVVVHSNNTEQLQSATSGIDNTERNTRRCLEFNSRDCADGDMETKSLRRTTTSEQKKVSSSLSLTKSVQQLSDRLQKLEQKLHSMEHTRLKQNLTERVQALEDNRWIQLDQFFSYTDEKFDSVMESMQTKTKELSDIIQSEKVLRSVALQGRDVSRDKELTELDHKIQNELRMHLGQKLREMKQDYIDDIRKRQDDHFKTVLIKLKDKTRNGKWDALLEMTETMDNKLLKIDNKLQGIDNEFTTALQAIDNKFTADVQRIDKLNNRNMEIINKNGEIQNKNWEIEQKNRQNTFRRLLQYININKGNMKNMEQDIYNNREREKQHFENIVYFIQEEFPDWNKTSTRMNNKLIETNQLNKEEVSNIKNKQEDLDIDAKEKLPEVMENNKKVADW